jgi:endonuclease YncB( thermonuclease family)
MALAIHPNASAEGTTAYEAFRATGVVVKNHDGDTIHLDTAGRGVLTIRLSGADTPETGQAHWRSARTRLRELVTRQQVTAECYKKDRHGRDVCHVSVGETDLGLDLIKGGHAWFASAFAMELDEKQRESYPAAEQAARVQKIGLWADPDPMPPWECRSLRKHGQKCR